MVQEIRDCVIWFLEKGQDDTNEFFHNHHKKTFILASMKIKIKSLKVYLDAVYSLISEDCVDTRFIDRILFITQCVILGASYNSIEDEKEEVPNEMILKNWIYKMMWISKDIIHN